MTINPLSYLSPKVAVKDSFIHGQGLFAVDVIGAGEIVCVKGGHIFKREQLRSLNSELGPSEIQVAEDLFIGPVTAEEELTHDWATTDDDAYEMECRCNAPNCRKIITGQDWRKKELQEKYRGFMSWYLQEKITKDMEQFRKNGVS